MSVTMDVNGITGFPREPCSLLMIRASGSGSWIPMGSRTTTIHTACDVSSEVASHTVCVGRTGSMWWLEVLAAALLDTVCWLLTGPSPLG